MVQDVGPAGIAVVEETMQVFVGVGPAVYAVAV